MNVVDSRAMLAERLRARLDQNDYPLSFSQQRLWFLDQLHPGSAVYNLPLSYRIRGVLDVDALEYAFNEVVRRHEVLRSVYSDKNAVPRQIVRPHATVALPVTDLSALPEREKAAEQLAKEEAGLPFDLANGPVIRARLLRIASDDHVLLLSLHHIAGDAWSLAIIGREISAHYKACLAGDRRSPLPDVPLQYADFSEWQAESMRGSARSELAKYWRAHLAGIPECISLPTDRPRPPIQSNTGAHIAFEIPAELVAAVDDFARRGAATPYVVLLSAFAVLLRRHAGDDNLTIGTSAASRHDARLEPVVGFFANTLVMRPAMAACRSFAELVRAVAAELHEALLHQDLPFELLVDELQPNRDMAHSPLFQVLLLYWDGEDEAVWDLPGCKIASSWGDSGTAKFDLTLSLTRAGAALRARLEYATALYDRTTAERIGAQFVELLRNAVANPDDAWLTLELLPHDERRLAVDKWARGADVARMPEAAHDRIAAQAARTPSALAVTDGNRNLTYRELDDAADALAERLRALGVTSNTVVGVYLDRSVLTVVALLGILKAGGAYLPLDPSYPNDRLTFMVADSGATIVVSRTSLLAAAGALGATVVPVDAVRRAPQPVQNAPRDRGELAYLIYTSGSTGRPKGVKVTHENVRTFFAAMDHIFGADAPGTWLAVTSISFDISVLELLWTLTRGYRVILRADEPTAFGARDAVDNGQSATRSVDVSLFFFGNAPADRAGTATRYRMLFDAARFGDEHGFAAVWTPERHFHAFGGLYPNPSVLAAALAATTQRIGIRAGSVVLPLHDPLRVAEEWALVDNLSGGRVGVSFASGWQPDDFVLAPERYAKRKQHMLDAIAEVRRLWRGERIRRANGIGTPIDVGVYPRPIQDELPAWITSARHPETFRMAGEAGTGLLTHLVGHTVEQLAEKIEVYRSAWRKSGHAGEGCVTLMLHTFVGEDEERVKNTVCQPLREYIRSSFDLMSGFGAAYEVDLRRLPSLEVEQLLDSAFERFFATSGLLGTVRQVADTLDRLSAIGVDEVGCLIDFGVDEAEVIASLDHLAAAREEHLRRKAAVRPPAEAGDSIAAQLKQYGVTHLQCTPSLAGVLVEDPQSREALRPIRRLLVGGEALPPELATALAEAVGGTVHNMYGPTEATVWATTSQVTSGRPPSIGHPLPGYRCYVVDGHLRPVPIGVPGELLLGGPAVADGYHARAELTVERFIPDHLSADAGGRLYRTGDLVRWRAAGELEFLGRLDHQVKLRGRRIELGEIESALAVHPAIRQVVCDVRGSGDAKGIVAYYVPTAGGALPAVAELRSFLALTLPEHMVPAAFVPLDGFPLTPNGKINRRALPEPGQAGPSREKEFRAPKGHLEEAIATVWREVLRLDAIGLDDNFFNVGGNSVLVVAVRSRLLERVNAELSLVDMFRYPTIAALAAALSARSQSGETGQQSIARAAAAGERRRGALARNRARADASGERA